MKPCVGFVRVVGRLRRAISRSAAGPGRNQALAADKAFAALKSPVVRVSLPDAPAPASSALEKVYYPDAKDIIMAIKGLVS